MIPSRFSFHVAIRCGHAVAEISFDRSPRLCQRELVVGTAVELTRLMARSSGYLSDVGGCIRTYYAYIL